MHTWANTHTHKHTHTHTVAYTHTHTHTHSTHSHICTRPDSTYAHAHAHERTHISEARAAHITYMYLSPTLLSEYIQYCHIIFNRHISEASAAYLSPTLYQCILYTVISYLTVIFLRQAQRTHRHITDYAYAHAHAHAHAYLHAHERTCASTIAPKRARKSVLE